MDTLAAYSFNNSNKYIPPYNVHIFRRDKYLLGYLLTGQVNGKLIKNDAGQVITTTNGRFDRNRGNNSIIDVIGTSVKAN